MIKFIIFVIFFSYLELYANENESALIETQNFLRNSEQVKNETLKNPNAKKADQIAEITSLGKKEFKQDIYNISADLLPWLVEQTNGDPDKMNALIMEAQKNPEAFYARIPASQKAQIKSLSEAIESNRTKKKKP